MLSKLSQGNGLDMTCTSQNEQLCLRRKGRKTDLEQGGPGWPESVASSRRLVILSSREVDGPTRDWYQ